MADAELQAIQAGLTGAHEALLRGALPLVRVELVRALDAMAAVTRQGLVPRQERAVTPWDGERALQLVWTVLARLHAEGCHAYPYAGTLLGLEREGRLLPHDKDADIAVWLEEFALAGRLLQHWGLRRATDVPPFANMVTFVDGGTGYTVDLYGHRRHPDGYIEAGVWLYGKPPDHQRLVRLPWYDLAVRPGPAGPVWWPQPADALLAALYADWRTPRPDWDSQISNPSVRDLNLSWECWALQGLCRAWLGGDLARTRRVLDQVTARVGERAPWSGWRAALDAGIALQADQPPPPG